MRVRDRKFFVRVTEYWPSACENDMSKKFNAIESFRYKGVGTFSSGGETGSTCQLSSKEYVLRGGNWRC